MPLLGVRKSPFWLHFLFKQICLIISVLFLSSQLFYDLRSTTYIGIYKELFHETNANYVIVRSSEIWWGSEKKRIVEGLVAVWGRCKLFGTRTALFLPSANIRPKSEPIGYIIRCTFRNYFKQCAIRNRWSYVKLHRKERRTSKKKSETKSSWPKFI